MSERLKFEGRRAVKHQEAERIKIRLKGLVTSLRDLLDPFEDVSLLRVDQIADQALQLVGLRDEYRAIVAEIAEINRVLGRG